MDVLKTIFLNHFRYICGILRQTTSSGLVRIVFCIPLEISNIKIIMTYADTITIMILRYLMLDTGAYETVKSTTSSIDETPAQVLELRPY